MQDDGDTTEEEEEAGQGNDGGGGGDLTEEEEEAAKANGDGDGGGLADLLSTLHRHLKADPEAVLGEREGVQWQEIDMDAVRPMNNRRHFVPLCLFDRLIWDMLILFLGGLLCGLILRLNVWGVVALGSVLGYFVSDHLGLFSGRCLWAHFTAECCPQWNAAVAAGSSQPAQEDQSSAGVHTPQENHPSAGVPAQQQSAAAGQDDVTPEDLKELLVRLHMVSSFFSVEV